MSQCFVRGWKVSTERIKVLVGANRFTAREVLESKANDKCREDVLMTLGHRDVTKGEAIATRALKAILEGELEAGEAYAYARVLELLLNHAGLPLAREYDPKWREPIDQIVLRAAVGPMEPPLFAACKLPALARV